MDLWIGAAQHAVDCRQMPQRGAKVETQLSFVNQLVSFLTLGIYTPMQIEVTCAAARAQSS
jgi:hypothetical protein